MTVGLPGSGKSTWAKEYISHFPETKRVNKDDLRAMLDNGKWSKDNEKFVLQIRDMLITVALGEGKDVIIDDTNLAPKHQERVKQLVEEYNKLADTNKAVFEIKDFTDVSVDECIKRDQKRANYVGEKVIRGMYRNFLMAKPAGPPADIEGVDRAIIVDMDGTLALFPGKNPYERDFINDEVNHPVLSIIYGYVDLGHRVIIVSGRKGRFLEETHAWLKKHEVPYDRIYMPRADEDNRKDVLIKQEIYEEHIKGKFNIDFVLDDRNQVVEFWRSQGLICLQVAEGDF